MNLREKYRLLDKLEGIRQNMSSQQLSVMFDNFRIMKEELDYLIGLLNSQIGFDSTKL